jgi:hypothetical protein
VLGAFQGRLYKNMALTSLQINDQGVASLSGYTTGYQDYARIYSSFTDNAASAYFTDVKPGPISQAAQKDDASGGQGSTGSDGIPAGNIQFSFTMKLTPKLLNPEAQ